MFHEAFDVYRLRDASALNQPAMIAEAKRISNTEFFGLSGDVCSTAVAGVLSKGTGITIKAFSPDGLTEGQFQRHPQLLGKSINIQAALREVHEAAEKRIDACKADVKARFQAGAVRLQGCLACTDLGRQQNLATLAQLRDREMTRCETNGAAAVPPR